MRKEPLARPPLSATMDDCIIIGAGPAGLTAAIYLSRFHLRIRLFDNGSSRAALIPVSHNHAGYPEGIPGIDLLALMRSQAERYGAVREEGNVTAITPVDGGFEVMVGDDRYPARSILLATGVVNKHPDMAEELHREALARGLLRYCPICDGYEVTDKRVGVVGTGGHGMREALFLRSYTKDVVLIAPGAAHDLDDSCRALLEDAGIEHIDGPCTPIRVDGDVIRVTTAAGERSFDSVYPAMGSHIRSELAVAAGAEEEDGSLVVDDHNQTSVKGLFAAGDVVKGLDQISHAMGDAGVAATAIRNWLNEQMPLRR